MSYPTYYISSSVVNVDTSTTPKILMLPTSSTIQGIPLTICDATGRADTNNIWISTQRFDLMDQFASTIRLTNSFQSFKVVPFSTTRYAITQNYTNGLTPFSYAVFLGYSFTTTGSSTYWGVAASSSSGSILATSDYDKLYISYTSGSSFQLKFTEPGGLLIIDVAMSGDGTYMVLSVNNSYLYTSSNSGTNWTQRDSVRFWRDVDCSFDGSRMIAVVAGATEYIYVSTNYGVTWNPVGAQGNYRSCAISADGSTMYVGEQAGYIYISTNAGGSWSVTSSPSASWSYLVCSSNGQIVYGSDTLYINISTDAGASWTSTFPNGYGYRLACSSDGSVVIGCDGTPGLLYASANGGSTFAVLSAPSKVYNVSLNSSGTQLFASTYPGVLYIGTSRIL